MGESAAAAPRAFVAVRDQVSCDLAGEVAVLHLGTGVYYTLNRTGARLWEALQEPRTLSDLQRVLRERWGEAPEEDVNRFLGRLADAGLVRESGPA